MNKDIEEFDNSLKNLSEQEAIFIIKALIAADYVSQFVVEKAIELAKTIRAED